MKNDIASICLPKYYNGLTGITALLVQRMPHDTIVWLAERTESADAFGGCWCSPGGKPDKDESLLDALGREIEEETGLKIASDRFEFAGVISIWKKGAKVPVWLFLTELEYGETPINNGDPALSVWEPFSLIRGPFESADNLLLTPGTAALIEMAKTRYER